MTDECPFCEIGSGRADRDLVAYRTDRVFVVPALKQRAINPGQVLICSNEHVTALHGLGPSLRAELFTVVALVTRAALAAFGAVGTTVLNNNDAPDQAISHLHVHVIPRFEHDGLIIPNPDRTPTSRDVRAQIAARLRQALSGQRIGPA
jgi:histidine triad (HIT) family protein